MRDFLQLEVWKKAHHLTLQVYRVTRDFPQCELYGITSQMRRASASVGSNIAEGAGKHSNAEFLRYLQIACGSASELQNHLILAKDLGFLNEALHRKMDRDVQEVKQMLTRFAQYLKGSQPKRKAES
jgi:four helix bundle protein